MPRVPIGLPSSPTVVTGAQARHLLKVLRLRPGDEVIAFDGRGHEWPARITHAGPSRVELSLGEERAPMRESPLSLILGQGVGKGEKLELVVRAATELGVASIVPVRTARSVATAEGESRTSRLTRIALEACKQSGRTRTPEIAPPQSLEEFLRRAADAELKLVAWEGATLPLRQALPEKAKTAALLVGPEGGLAEEEVRQAESSGFRAVSLGPRILRTETAGIVLVAALQARLGDLG